MIFNIYMIVFLFFMGSSIGTFISIYGLKTPLKDKEYFNKCEKCNYEYKWFEMIPVLSYFINGDTCNHCHTKKSKLVFFVELFDGLFFIASYFLYGFSYEMLIMDIITVLLSLVFITDFKYYLILDEYLVLISIMVLLLKLIFFGIRTFLISLVSGLLLLIFMLTIRFIGNILLKQESLGLGDVKLSFVFGTVLGIRLGAVSLIIGSFIALPFAIINTLSHKNNIIAFGPYLSLGLLTVFLFLNPILKFLNIIFKYY